MMQTNSVSYTKSQILIRLIKFARPYWSIFFLGVMATIAGSFIDAGLAWLIKPVINKGFIERDVAFIQFLPILIIFIFLVRGISGFISDYFIARVGRNLVRDFRQVMFTHLMGLPAQFYDQQSSGKLLSALIYNVEQIAEAICDSFAMALQEGFLFIGLVIVMISISWQLSLIFWLAAPLMIFLFHYSSKRVRRLSIAVQEGVGDVCHVAEEGIEGYRVIRTFGGQDYETEKFNKATQQNRHRELKVVVTNSLGTTGVQWVASLLLALILFLALHSSFRISAGSFAAMVATIMSLLRPLRRLTKMSSKLQKGLVGAQSVFELLDQPQEVDTGTIRVQRVRGHIEYRNISFNYPNVAKPVLDNVSFIVEPGKRIALVGKSGAGKSTLVGLLPRFYDPTQGSILIDGIDTRDYQLKNLREQFALVSQHVVLFNDTLANNIAYGKEGNTDEKTIWHALEAAHATDFVHALPEGLATMIGENGVLLSGGQRQRIAIARAVLKNAPILILDEATSALDSHSERHIQDALDELMRDRTTLVIAHRLSTIENADEILVLDQGRIVERGSHRELLSRGGYYARLHALQFAGHSDVLEVIDQ